jgi:DNA-binding CsgD family transcriptional regulator
MEDFQTIILPPEVTVPDDLGIYQAFEFFAAATGFRWATLEIRTRGSNRERLFEIGRRSKPSVPFELEIDDFTTAVLTVDGETLPSKESLNLLTAILGRELHRLRLLAEATLLRGAIEATSDAFLLFGPTGTIVFANGPGDELISKQTEDDLRVDWNGGGPQPFFRVLCTRVGQLLDDGVHQQSLRDRFQISNGVEITSELVMLEPGAEGFGRVVLAIIREIGGPRDHLIDNFAIHHRLSPREREVLRLLVQGYDTAGLADRMGISPHTVRDHLKNVFRKTSTRSRSELLSALAGAGNPNRQDPKKVPGPDVSQN